MAAERAHLEAAAVLGHCGQQGVPRLHLHQLHLSQRAPPGQQGERLIVQHTEAQELLADPQHLLRSTKGGRRNVMDGKSLLIHNTASKGGGGRALPGSNQMRPSRHGCAT
jgi:hypothetical protein